MGSLGTLNPFPWPFMTGNCLGWIIYAYYTHDPFVLSANLPGLILSLWLNFGAIKLQYLERMYQFKPSTPSIQQHPYEGQRPLDPLEQQQQQHDIPRNSNHHHHWDASPPLMDQDEGRELLGVGVPSPDDATTHRQDQIEQLIMVSQERALLRILIAWSLVAVVVGWFDVLAAEPATVVGVTVNLNLIVFYGAPLQSIQTVLATKRSDSIHVPTMMMNWCNTSFWMMYGLGRHDLLILMPNSVGLILGLAQGVLCVLYPPSRSSSGSAQDSSTTPSPSGENHRLPGVVLVVDDGESGVEQDDDPEEVFSIA
jgi:solute carrier family 50 (sugar transporter)